MMASSKFLKVCSQTFCILVLIISCGKNPESKKATLTGEALGTTYQITYFSEQPLQIINSVDSVFQVINKSMSTYLPNSDISKINRGDSTIKVDHMFREVFELSKDIHLKTDGYFDPTVGILTDAWGFGPGKSIVMDSSKVDSLLRYVGLHKVSIREDFSVDKELAGIRLDFNAIAKGYAIDRLGLMLDSLGVVNYLVEVGGEVIAKGENIEKGSSWTVGVDDPEVKEERELIAVITLDNRALASSGNYRKFRIDSVSGKKFVHTIDPKTGYTKNSNILAASVITTTCAEADAYATAFMAMPLETSKEVLTKNTNLEAFIVYIDQAGEIAVHETPGFKARRIR